MKTNIRAVLYGTLTGAIWMPAVECTKQVQVDLTRERERLTPTRGGSLRYMVGSICNDGDFRSARLTEDTVIEVTCRWRNCDGYMLTRTKTIPITKFKDIQDYVEAV